MSSPFERRWRNIAIVIAALCLPLFVAGCGSGPTAQQQVQEAASQPDKMTVDMAPMRVIAFADDGYSDLLPLYPLLDWRFFPKNSTYVLARVADPYSKGDFYSIKVHNSFSAAPYSGSSNVGDGEADDTPATATTLTYGTYVNRDLSPSGDEDWYTYTFAANPSRAEIWIVPGNASGTAGDPVLEIYDPEPDPGPLTLLEGPINTFFGNPTYRGIAAVYDPSNDVTLIATGIRAPDVAGSGEGMSYFYAIIFSGAPTPGNHAIELIFPPMPDDHVGTVTINASGYRLVGTYAATISAGTQTTTVSGKFNVFREPNAPGLFDGALNMGMWAGGGNAVDMRKAATSYLRRLK